MTFEGLSPFYESDTTNRTALVDSSVSALGKYTVTSDIYRCPADNSFIAFGGTRYKRVRSYSMNGFVGSRIGRPERDYLRMADIIEPSPSSLFVFSEEHDDYVHSGYYVGASVISSSQWGSLPTARHRRSAIFSFADGHIDQHRWQDKQTFQPVTRSGVTAPTVPNSKDIPWLSSHATAWK
jgi:prepilin-type processing-associated H-X9-DG protein